MTSRDLTQVQLNLLEELSEFMEEKTSIIAEYKNIKSRNNAIANEFDPIFRTGIRENMEGIGEYLEISNDVLFEQSMKSRVDGLKNKESDILYTIYTHKIPGKYVASILGIKINAYHRYLSTHTVWYRLLREQKKCQM